MKTLGGVVLVFLVALAIVFPMKALPAALQAPTPQMFRERVGVDVVAPEAVSVVLLGPVYIEPDTYLLGQTRDSQILRIFGWQKRGEIEYDTHIGGVVSNDILESRLCGEIADCGQRFEVVRMDESTPTPTPTITSMVEPTTTPTPTPTSTPTPTATPTPEGTPPPTPKLVIESQPDGQRHVEVTFYETPCPEGIYGRAYHPVVGLALVGLATVVFGVFWLIIKLKG
jgi:hypothetical protein